MRIVGALIGSTVFIAACSPAPDETALPPLPDDPAVSAELRNIFNTHDEDGDGTIADSDLGRFGGGVFAGMDVRTDGEIAPREWRGFGFLESTARANGRSTEYEAAKRSIFQRYDTDDSATLSENELRDGVRSDFAGADDPANGAGTFSYEEFTASRLIREIAAASAPPA